MESPEVEENGRDSIGRQSDKWGAKTVTEKSCTVIELKEKVSKENYLNENYLDYEENSVQESIIKSTWKAKGCESGQVCSMFQVELKRAAQDGNQHGELKLMVDN